MADVGEQPYRSGSAADIFRPGSEALFWDFRATNRIMPGISSRLKDHDFTRKALRVVEPAIEGKWDGSRLPDPHEGKNPAAVALGKLSGAKGGAARAAALSPRKRKMIARKAAQAHWKYIRNSVSSRITRTRRKAGFGDRAGRPDRARLK